MLWLKACPRCQGGDLHSDRDMYGAYACCLQCGHYLTEAEQARLTLSAAKQILQPSALAHAKQIAS